MATLSPPLSPPTPQSSPPPSAAEGDAAGNTESGEAMGASTTRSNGANNENTSNANDANEANEANEADEADDSSVTQPPHRSPRLAPQQDTNDADANVADTSAATTQSPLRRTPRLAPKTPPLAHFHHDAGSPDVGMGIAVSHRRSPRITYRHGSFRQLLHDYSSVERPASPASWARRQSSHPATAAARSQLDMARLEGLFDPGLGGDSNESDDEQKDDATNSEDEDGIYSEHGSGESDGDDSDRKSTSTAKTAVRGKSRRESTGGKRKRKARSDRSRPRETDSEDFTDATSASTTSGQGVIVPVPAPEEFHDDWEAWDEYFKMYCAMTRQKIVVEESKKRQWRIDRIFATKEYQELVEQEREDEYPIPPEEFDYFQRTYVCTHGGNSRKSRGKKKKRVRQYLRYHACPFRFVVQVSQCDGSSWGLQVRLGVFEHNHAVSREVFRTYPVECGVKMDTNVQQVETMLNARVKRSKIYDFLLAQGENVIKPDVDNMVAGHRTRVSTADDNEATAIQLAEFAVEDRKNLVTVDESHRGHSAVISITTVLMRTTYARFPQLLLVDCTHKTNRYNYQLCTFMVIDEHGEGAVVEHSLFETNSDWRMEAALAHFLRAHPTAATMLPFIMADKELNEIRVLKTRFPLARILICVFHVIKYFSVAAKKPEFGSISPEDRQSVEH